MSVFVRPKRDAGITLQQAKARIEALHYVKEVNIVKVGEIPTLEVVYQDGASNKKVKGSIHHVMRPHPFSIWVIRDDDQPARP